MLPTDLLFRQGEPCFPSALLKELHGDLAPNRVGVQVRRGIDLADERDGALVNQRLEFHLVHDGKCHVEQIAGFGTDGGEVAVEEDGVQNACVS